NTDLSYGDTAKYTFSIINLHGTLPLILQIFLHKFAYCLACCIFISTIPALHFYCTEPHPMKYCAYPVSL
ncbi:MAG: hypothetical protein PUH04_03720, partial [Firmicutes bacterium]|nr:hypothetical protein [Bacillota bacterium]